MTLRHEPAASRSPPMRVLALAKYGTRAASTRQRMLQYEPFLARHGVDLNLRPLLDNNYLDALMSGQPKSRTGVARSYIRRLGDLLTVGHYDTVWVQYDLLPYLPLLDGLLPVLSRTPVVYDLDDAVFHMYDAHRSAIVRRLLGGKLKPLMRRAAVCLCGNAYLQDYVTAAGGRGIVVPTVVDTDHFCPVTVRASNQPFTVGWIGSPSTWRYVEPLLPTLLPALAQMGARFLVVGAGVAARGIAGVDVVDWTQEGEVPAIQSMDVGLMPVPDYRWERGKCGYKLIQYMACGLPVIASPVGVNATLVTSDEGFAAHNLADWITALQTLSRNPSMRARMGANGRAKVVAHYSLASQEPVVLNALHAAAERTT